MKGLP